ncbi:MAG: sigma-54-dependent Fis family transcriptional regulator [Rhodobiaceae bacterium]|nr:sigma-54-dependent Fis family transcriptional regulator [Rhodobiaceae bacterium]MCC0015552.1 sigma-54-dependent Fis family transcriptional regulator [Rhodobiaceae bacterium]MCC0040882.1 sigma-54-dependent Fis family transcriptional regulator [Rhodobiaceae bacterium]MCC0053209.1 sigma-54-dependent Fis family transcriptional regulator [Rhodobiaceae bacterium]
MADRPLVLLVDDDDDLRLTLAQGLELAGFAVEAFAGAEGVLEHISQDFAGVLVSDIRLPGIDGVALMKAVLDVDAAMPVVLITGHGDVSMAVDAMKAGAYDFIEKPFATSALEAVVTRAIDRRRLVLENRVLREQLSGATGLEERIVGRSAAAVQLRKQVAMIAATDADVLIVGETGAGKEVIARALHDTSPRADRPFVAINCAALPAEIIESELFGHVAGAFTGARDTRIGKLEHADGGTVFLDEIESMPLDLQAKLLRVIETRSLERLGANETISLNIRFLAASKADLARLSAGGGFREDLYYRLNVVTIAVPALAQRRDDIPVLLLHLMRKARARYRRDMPELSAHVLAALSARDWPGNVRELRNIADRLVLGVMDPAEISEAEASSGGSGNGVLGDQVAAFERAVIVQALAANGGRLKPTYEALGVSRKTLYDKMQRLGIERQPGSDVQES